MHDFEQIYLEYYKRVYAFLYKMCRDKEICEDLTQETFLVAFKVFHKYNGTCTVFTFLAAIAKNVYLKHLYKNRVSLVDLELVEGQISETETPENEFIRQSASQNVRDKISLLPKKYMDVVLLRTYAELSFSDIAKITKISESSAKVIFFRAKKMLKEAIEHEQ